MHETNSKNVKGFLESNVYVSSEKYSISGWASNPNRQIVGFVLTDHNGEVMKSVDYVLNREDVMITYKGDQSYLKSGFSIDFKVFPGNEVVFLNVEYEGGEIERILGRKIISWNQRYTGVFQYCTAEDPIVYHADMQSYAAVVYLTPDAPPETGTTFWRSRNNKVWRSPMQEDLDRLNQDHNTTWYQMFGNPPNFYDGTRWEMVDKIGNRYNRLAIWDAKLIHSASQYFGANINDSRLFHMFFFDCE